MTLSSAHFSANTTFNTSFSGWQNSGSIEQFCQEFPPEQAVELAVFLQCLSQALNQSYILDEVFDDIGQVLTNTFNFDAFTFALLEPSGQGIMRLIQISPDGFADVTQEHNRSTLPDPILQPIIQHRTAAFLGLEHQHSSILFPGFPAVTAVYPLVNKGVLLGLLACSKSIDALQANATAQAVESPLYGSPTSGEAAFNTSNPFANPAQYFSLKEQRFLEASLPLLALSLEHAHLYTRSQNLRGRMFLMHRMNLAIRQSLNLGEMLTKAASELGQLLGASRCFVYAFETPMPLVVEAEAILGNPPPKVLPPFTYHQHGLKPFRPEKPYNQPFRFEWEVLQAWINQLNETGTRSTVGYQLNEHHLPFEPLYFTPASQTHSKTWLGPSAVYEKHQVQSLCLYPIVSSEAWLGVLVLHQCDKVRLWAMEDQELLAGIAEHLGLAMGQARLFSQVQEQNTQLEQAYDDLQEAQVQLVQTEKMAVLGQFVAGIAHEVNTPLGSIISNTQTLTRLLERTKAALPTEAFTPETTVSSYWQMANELLGINELAGSRIKEIIVNLRNFARLDDSDQVPADLHEALDSTLLILRSSFPQSLILEKHYATNLPKVNCFLGPINQVLMNLMGNALHAMEAVTVPVLTLRTGVALHEQLGQAVFISIQDNGKGIAPEHLSKIFDPGFTTKARGVGTGLGLALCYKTAEKHKGLLTVDSKPNEGACFTLWLPL
jgi:signal transduction histidine kinase